MNTLLIYFAFPIAVIIFSIILQKLLNNPIAVASLIFAIFIVITFAAFDENFLIATLAYTIIAFITALIAQLLKNRNHENTLCDTISNILQNNSEETESVADTVEDLLGTSTNNNNGTCNCGCNRNRRR